jgi:hydroxyacylglutathione hydrolase
MITITPISAFNDNYIWLVNDQKNAIVIDPGDPNVVSNYLEQKQLNLVGILITHHHQDHTGGVKQLLDRYSCPVWGPKDDPVQLLDFQCTQGDIVEIGLLGIKLQVLSVPGHTKGHIAYYLESSSSTPNALFCGDTLFSGGCGRLFEGTAKQMWHSLQKLANLPGETLVCAAHEYTLSNLAFALEIEPNNQNLIDYHNRVKQLRHKNRPSLPSTIGLELEINPFMRVSQIGVINAAKKRSLSLAKSNNVHDWEVLAIIRQAKDIF